MYAYVGNYVGLIVYVCYSMYVCRHVWASIV